MGVDGTTGVVSTLTISSSSWQRALFSASFTVASRTVESASASSDAARFRRRVASSLSVSALSMSSARSFICSWHAWMLAVQFAIRRSAAEGVVMRRVVLSVELSVERRGKGVGGVG